MKEQILKIADDLRNGAIDEQKAWTLLLGLLSVSNWPSWLKEDDVAIAKLYYQNGEKLIAVKHLCEIAKPHLETPLKWAKTFIEACC